MYENKIAKKEKGGGGNVGHDPMYLCTQRMPHIIMCTQKTNQFEFLKNNNICSLTAILNESISKLCGLSMKCAQI